MLRSYHGASTPGRVFSQSQRMAMSSFSGTTGLAADAMRSITSMRARASSATASRKTQRMDRTWSPANGIVFANGGPALACSPRSLSTASLSTLERTTHTIEETYILSNKINPSTSQPSDKPTSAPPSSGNASWIPPSHPNTSSSQAEPSNSLSTQTPKPVSEESTTAEKGEGIEEEVETHTPLSFTIPAEALQKAKDATPDTADSFWTHRLYSGPDNAKVKVHYCKSRHTTESVLQKHFMDQPILGFDIEWKMNASRYSSPKKNVSLIQIACEDRILLSHIALFPKDSLDELVAPSLKKIMEDPEVTKCGVAIKADCTRLRKFLGVNVRGIFELSHLHRLTKYSESGEYGLVNKRLTSLSTQASEHLELPIFKGEVRGSDWSEPLSMEQILYAASDAYAGFVLYNVLEAKRKALRPTPPRPWHAELNRPIRLADGVEVATMVEDAAAEEALEEAEPRKTSADAEAQDLSTLDVAIEPADKETTISSQPAKSAAKPTAKKVDKPTHPVVEAGAAFAASYRAANPMTAASAVSLRAYHIWHWNPGMSTGEIAAVLRSPPLQVGTVRNYILEALRLEGMGVMGSAAWACDGDGDGRGLVVDKARLRGLLEGLGEKERGVWRLKGLWKAVGGDKKGAEKGDRALAGSA